MIDLVGAKLVDEFLEAFPAKASVAIRRAISRGTDAARTQANRLAAKDMGLKVADVRKRTRTIPPKGDSLTGEVRASLERVPLIEFSKKKRPGHAFTATMRSGHTGIFKRKGRSRLPIQELRGSSVGHVVLKHVAEIFRRGAEQSEVEMNRQLARLIGGRSA